MATPLPNLNLALSSKSGADSSWSGTVETGGQTITFAPKTQLPDWLKWLAAGASILGLVLMLKRFGRG